jgi:hypothetical protein
MRTQDGPERRLAPATQQRTCSIPGRKGAALASLSFFALGGALSHSVQAQATRQPDEIDYQAREGDTLSGLAQRMLLPTITWQKLYDRNKDRIKDVRQIPIGTHIYIAYAWLREQP